MSESNMKKWRVTLERTITERAVVEVEAEDKDEAG
jgi:hypothetical protein